jgi:hypothetical protein
LIRPRKTTPVIENQYESRRHRRDHGDGYD